MGLFGGGTTDRGELLELQARVARLEERVARLTVALDAQQAPPPEDDAPLSSAEPVAEGYAEARSLAAAGNKIHAIKVVREQSGMSLRAAKDLVESW